MRIHGLATAAAAICVLFLTACGGSGSGEKVSESGVGTTGNNTGGTPGGEPALGNRAPYSVSVTGGSFGTTPVRVSSDSITIGSRTVQFDVSSQVGSQTGHYRDFDTAGTTSGPAIEVHYFGKNEGFSHLQFGTWAKGYVSPNPGFRIGEEFGAFLAPVVGSSLTSASNLPTTGHATWRGKYAGYVDREGVGVSQVVGSAAIVAAFGPGQHGDGGVIVTLGVPDPNRSSFAAAPPGIEYSDIVQMNGIIKGNTFESDVTATYTVLGQTVPRGDAIVVYGGPPEYSLYSPGSAHSGGIRGGFFGNRAGEAGGTYHFTVGRTKAAGSFGGNIE